MNHWATVGICKSPLAPAGSVSFCHNTVQNNGVTWQGVPLRRLQHHDVCALHLHNPQGVHSHNKGCSPDTRLQIHTQHAMSVLKGSRSDTETPTHACMMQLVLRTDVLWLHHTKLITTGLCELEACLGYLCETPTFLHELGSLFIQAEAMVSVLGASFQDYLLQLDHAPSIIFPEGKQDDGYIKVHIGCLQGRCC